MVEKSHTAAGRNAGWWPSVYAPLRGVGERVADYFAPDTDAAATDDFYEINVELPGVSADNIDVSVHENTLTIKGEKRSEHEEEGKTYFFSERSYGAFQRSFRLPSDAISDQITADFKDGVLSLMIGKKGPPAETSRKVHVRRA